MTFGLFAALIISSRVALLHLLTEHERVEVVDLLSVDGVVAHLDVVVGVPVELRHPDGQLELFPE